MKKYLTLFFCLLLFSGGCGSGTDLKVRQLNLDNGLVVLVHEKHDLPIVIIKAQIKASSLYEPEEKAGLAYFVGRMLTKGTKNRNAEKIASLVDFVGGDLYSEVGKSHSFLVYKALKDHLNLGLDLIWDILLNASFPSTEVEKEKDFILTSIRSQKIDPEVVAFLAFNRIIYGKHPFHRPAMGYYETVRAIRREDLLDFYQRYYVPNNTIITIIGDVNSEELITKVAEKFAKWKKKDVAFPLFPSAESQKAIIKKKIFMEKEQVQVLLGHLGIRRLDPDYYSLLVMDVILGAGDMSSRIPRIIRDVEGLAYIAYADITQSSGVEPGQFKAYLAVSPKNVDRAVRILLREIRKIREELVTEQEIADAKSYLINNFYFALQGIEALADYLLFCETFNLSFDFITRYPKYIEKVSREDVRRAAQKHLFPEAYTLVLVGKLK